MLLGSAKKGLVGAGASSQIMPLLLIGLAWAVAWCIAYPVGDFPLNDDWTYALAVKSILEKGRFTLIPWSTANVFAQAYWGALFCLPFGFSYEALRVSTFVLATVGVLATYLLLLELGAERRYAVIGGLTLAANPLYLQLSTTFMTDVPFTALVIVSLWLYVRGTNREAMGLTLAAYVFVLFAILVRQFAIVLPIAFGAAYLARKRITAYALIVALAPVLFFVAVHLGFQRWMIETGRSVGFNGPVQDLARTNLVVAIQRNRTFLLLMLPYLGLFTLPFSAYVAMTLTIRSTRPLRYTIFWFLSAFLATVVYVVLAIKDRTLPSLGNVLLTYGMGPLTLKDTYNLHLNFPHLSNTATFWTVLTLLSCWAVAVLALATLQTVTRIVLSLSKLEKRQECWPQVLLLTLAASYLATLFALGSFADILDRYLIVFVVPLCALILITCSPLTQNRPWQLIPVGGLLAIFALVSVIATHDWLAWNRARWQAVEYLTIQGILPSQIDGGYEFNGLYLYRADYQSSKGRSWWWTDGDEYMIASGPVEGYKKVQEFQFSHWLWPTEYQVLALRRL